MTNQPVKRLILPFFHLLLLAAIVASSALVAQPAQARALSSGISGGQTFDFESKEGGGTPFQQALKEAIKEQQKLGLPVPAMENYDYKVFAVPQETNTTGNAVEQVTITGKTVVRFDNPQQAGYDKWPAPIVVDELPSGATGSVAHGDYSETIRKAVDEALPGFWEENEFGYEPRTYVFEETFEVIPSNDEQAEALATAIYSGSLSTDEILMGFTNTGPNINYHLSQQWRACAIWCVTIAEANASFVLNWAYGLRLPIEVSLDAPEEMAAGSVYSLESWVTPLDWNAQNYFDASDGNVPSEGGAEFVLRFNFDLSFRVRILGVNVIDYHQGFSLNKSQSFMTPFGTGNYFPIPPMELPPEVTGLYYGTNWAWLGIGLTIVPQLGSTKITAEWQVRGDASGGGLIEYTQPESRVTLQPVNAGDFGPGSTAEIQLTGFRYWFNQFLITLRGYLEFRVFGYGNRTGNFQIGTIDASRLTGGLYLRVHNNTPLSVTRTVQVEAQVTTLPATGLSLLGTVGNNGWYRSDVQVTLTTIPGAASEATTYYSLDNFTWNQYTTPFTISEDGYNTLNYYSSDENGVEPQLTELIKIDQTPPAVLINSPLAQEYAHTDTLQLDWTINEGTSGLVSESADLDGSPVGNGQVLDLFPMQLGPHNLIVNAADEAGNNTTLSVTFYVGVDIDSLIEVLQRMYELGWIQKQGIARSLFAKLNTAMAAIESEQFDAARGHLNAFLNELEAQKDKAVNQQAYEILYTDAMYLLSTLP